MTDHHDEPDLEAQLDMAAEADGPLADELARQVTLAAARASELRDVATEVRQVANEVRSLHEDMSADLDSELVHELATIVDRNTVRSSVALGVSILGAGLAGLAVWLAASIPHLPITAP